MEVARRENLYPEAEAEEEEQDSKKTRTVAGLAVCSEDPGLLEPFIVAAMERIDDDNEPPSDAAIQQLLGSVTVGGRTATGPKDRIDEEYPHLMDDVEAQEKYCVKSGRVLHKGMLKAARRKEVGRLHEFVVYDWVPAEQCRGKKKIGSRWNEEYKFDDNGEEIIRARLVGKEFAFVKIEDAFAATPPLKGAGLSSRCARANRHVGEESW
jgi:uncharacterized protein YggL (DUF469 family)